MVTGHVGVLVDRSQLELAWRHLVVAGLGWDAKADELVFHILHEALHTGGNGTKVVVLKLLPLGRGSAKKGPSTEQKVRTKGCEVFVHQKVFLFGAHLCMYACCRCVAKKAQYAQSLLREGSDGADERDLAIERLARIGVEEGGNVQGCGIGSWDHEDRHGRIPGRVAAGLEGRAYAARREGGRIRLAAYEHLAGKVADGLAVAYGREEGIVLFRSGSGHGLEPVGVVGGTLCHGPFLHGSSNAVRHGRIEATTAVDDALKVLVDILRQALAHLLQGEDVFAKYLVCALVACGPCDRTRCLGRKDSLCSCLCHRDSPGKTVQGKHPLAIPSGRLAPCLVKKVVRTFSPALPLKQGACQKLILGQEAVQTACEQKRFSRHFQSLQKKGRRHPHEFHEAACARFLSLIYKFVFFIPESACPGLMFFHYGLSRCRNHITLLPKTQK